MVRFWLAFALSVAAVSAAEADAARILADLRSRHLPYGAILDPVFRGYDSTEIVGYTRCGDSAIWTGHYLAAEAYRYAVRKSPDSLNGVRVGLEGIQLLVDVTGTGLLARCAVPADSPHAAALLGEEQHHGFHHRMLDGAVWVWVGNTSRDQYLGVFFGLTAVWNLVDDPQVRDAARGLATRMLDNLRAHNWAVVMPDGEVSTSFALRADQQLMLLKLGRRANEGRFGSDYSWRAAFSSGATVLPIAAEVMEPHESYFKFNLDHITFYGLLTGGDSGFVKRNYDRSFAVLRNTLDGHGNAFFDLIDRAVRGPDAARDAGVVRMLEEWLTRPRRDLWVDRRAEFAACGENRACDPLPVPLRVRTDFLWQRSPFQLSGGGPGLIEGPGIDYLLPYWMARYYGILSD